MGPPFMETSMSLRRFHLYALNAPKLLCTPECLSSHYLGAEGFDNRNCSVAGAEERIL